MTERAALWLVLEQRNGHLNDHVRASHDASMITVAGSEPGPGGVGPGASICTGCADGGGGGQGKHRMGLGHGGPGTRNGLAVALAEQPVRLSGKFLSPAVMLWSVIDTPLVSLPDSESDTMHTFGNFPTVACPPGGLGTGRWIGASARCGTDVGTAWGKAWIARGGPGSAGRPLGLLLPGMD